MAQASIQGQSIKKHWVEEPKAQNPDLLTILPYSNNLVVFTKVRWKKKKTITSITSNSANKKTSS